MSRSSAEAELRWTGFESRFLASYCAFASREFGRFEYQANPNYVRWLYAENPSGSQQASDCLLGLRADDQVVACIHKLRFPWRIGATTGSVPALHNLMAAPGYRHGIGALLILTALAKDRYAVVLGAEGDVSLAYERVGCRKVEASWYRWVINPASLAVGMSKNAIGLRPTPWPVEGRLGLVRRALPRLVFETAPSRARMEELAVVLARNVADENVAAPAWTAELVQWRFFHPIGPRHLLVASRSQDFVAVVSLGIVRGARVARIVELRGTSPDACRWGLRDLKIGLGLLGAGALFGFSADPETNRVLREAGARPRAAHPSAWFYARRRAPPVANVSFSGAAGDWGFDAI